MDLTFRYLLHFCQKTFPTYHCSFAQINFHKLIIWTNYPLRCAFLQYAGACPKIYFQKGSHAAVTQKDSLRVVRFPIQEFIVGQLFRRLNQISCSLKCAFLKNDFIMNAPLVSWTYPAIKSRWVQEVTHHILMSEYVQLTGGAFINEIILKKSTLWY